MRFWHRLKVLMRRPKFRRLFGVRLATQTADGTLQVGMASYVLFSPQNQPSAWAIAAVLAITLLPFSVVGPFVSVVLDRWPRQRVTLITDLIRAVIALSLAFLVGSGNRGPGTQVTLFALLLVAMSLNRFLLAGLGAGMTHTVERSQYLMASSVLPMIGPIGVLIGAAISATMRLGFTPSPLATYQADAIVFAISALLFLVSVALTSRFKRWDLGPDPEERAHTATVSQIAAGLRAALVHLRDEGPAGLSIAVIGGARLLFGVWTVAMLLAWRNHFHAVNQVNGAIGDVTIWGAATGIGFVASVALAQPLAQRIGLRNATIVLLIASAVATLVPGALFSSKIALYLAGFLIGWFAQAIKICVDTIVQSHVSDAYKGRTFVLYDMVFNTSMVIAAVIAALVLPVGGLSGPAFVGIAIGYLVLALGFAVAARRFRDPAFTQGTKQGETPLPVSS